jgi:hypothetical protein
MVSSKLVWNSTISTPGACFGVTEIKNMYLDTPLNCYEYRKIPILLLPQTLLTITSYLRRPFTDMSMWKSIKECMAYHRLVSLPANSSKNTLPNTGTTNNHTPLDYGNMSLAPSGSILQ